jgi:outer membrane immunogenic protein
MRRPKLWCQELCVAAADTEDDQSPRIPHRWLVYATGGLAFSQVSMSGNYIATIGTLAGGGPGLYPASSGSASDAMVGGTIGAGVVYALSKNWEIGAEYRYTDYGKGNFNLGPVAGACANVGAAAPVIACLNTPTTGHKDVTTSEILFKLNYRFDWATPVVAKY